jgi:hypothetical protein
MRLVRFSGFGLLAIYLALHLFFPTVWSELFAFNLVSVAAIVVISSAPHISDRIAKPTVAIAVGFWTIGSILASLAIFYSSHTVSNTISGAMYLLFYPLAIVGLPRLLAANRKLTVIELVDSSIFGLGLSTLCSALVAKPVLPHFSGNIGETFFAIMYPIADLILVCVVIATVFMQGYSRRGLVLTLGVALFSMTDIIFLWQTFRNL